jgi:hypothetical protein
MVFIDAEWMNYPVGVIMENVSREGKWCMDELHAAGKSRTLPLRLINAQMFDCRFSNGVVAFHDGG